MKINQLHQDIISKLSPSLEGVFTLEDIRSALGTHSDVAFYRDLKGLIRANIIRRFSREIYVTENFNLNMASQKLCSESYISFGNVLAKENIIGTVPDSHITAVKVGKKRIYQSSSETIIHLGISEHLYFGFEIENGIQFANPEKAFLDTLYFYQKGYKFYFDVYSDINVRKLNILLIKDYLIRYKNPKFIAFVNEYLANV